jgi:hypothetical protein
VLRGIAWEIRVPRIVDANTRLVDEGRLDRVAKARDRATKDIEPWAEVADAARREGPDYSRSRRVGVWRKRRRVARHDLR